MHARAFMRSLAKSGDPQHATFTRTSLTFTSVPAKVPHIHQSSGEGALGMWVASRVCPNVGVCPCASRFCTGRKGSVSSTSKCLRDDEAKSDSSEAQSVAPRWSWKPRHQQHLGPENQDSQHMLNQPRVIGKSPHPKK